MKKGTILTFTILCSFLILIMPCIPAVNIQNAKNAMEEKIEVFNENIQNKIKSIASKIDNNFFEDLITLILKIIYNLSYLLMGIGWLIMLPYLIIMKFIESYFPQLTQILANTILIIVSIPFYIGFVIWYILYDILYIDTLV